MLTEGCHKLAVTFKRCGKRHEQFPIAANYCQNTAEMITESSPSPANTRLPGLDYLRGLSAFGIMIYHYSSWAFGEQSASNFLGRVGIYGVAIFYILSGQTLSYVYGSKLRLNLYDLSEFYKRRFFRIFPLLWLATILSILLSKRIPNSTDVFLNLTGLFGIVKWDVYFATGAWSIGNELCFYLTFPLFIFVFNQNRAFLYLLILLTVGIFLYFTFGILDPNTSLSSQWHLYTNPLNQILFFLAGTCVGRLIQPTTLTLFQSAIIGTVGLLIFLLLPVQGNAIELVAGPNRLFFAISCFLVCCSFFRNIRPPEFIDRPLLLLGQASYSLYLMHPLVFAVVKASCTLAARFILVPVTSIFFISIIASLSASYLSYRYFESYFIKISHKRSTTSTV